MNEKIIRRADLRSSLSPSRSSSSSGSSRRSEALHAQLNEIVQFVETGPPAGDTVMSQGDEVDGSREEGEGKEDIYSFRLFSTAAPASTDTSATKAAGDVAPVSRIRLVSPSGEGGSSDFTSITKRPLTFYIARPFSPSQRDIAMSGSEILELSKRACPGLAYPWRVRRWPSHLTHLTHHKKTSAATAATVAITADINANADNLTKRKTDTDCMSTVEIGEAEDSRKGKRTRKGKKSRIALRKKMAAKRDAAAEKVRAEKEREEHLREKKTRLNRVKQLRRREKARAQKAGLDGTITNVTVSDTAATVAAATTTTTTTAFSTISDAVTPGSINEGKDVNDSKENDNID